MSGITLNTFRQTAQIASDDKTIKLSGDSLTSTGKFGTFFTFNSTNRATMAAFMDAVKSEYGDFGAQMAYNRLAGDYAAGKPLTAFTVKQVMNAIASPDPKADQNTFLKTAFITGVNLIQDKDSKPIPTKFNLDTALDNYLNRFRSRWATSDEAVFPDEYKSLLKQNIVLDLMSNRLQFNSLQEMNQAVSDGKLGGVDMLQLKGNLYTSLTSLNTFEDTCHLCRLLAPSFGTTRDETRVITNTVEVAIHQLQKMRDLQPEGPLKLATIWEACLPGEELSSELASNPEALLRELTRRITVKINDHENSLPERPPVATALLRGAVMDRALNLLPLQTMQQARNESVAAHCTLRPIEFDGRIPGSKFSDQTVDSAFNRCMVENAGLRAKVFSGAPIEFAFHDNDLNSPGHSLSMTADNMIADSSGNVLAELRNKDDSELNSKERAAISFSNNFRNDLDTFAGSESTPEQRRTIIASMSQNSNFKLRMMEGACGVPFEPEKSAYSFDLAHGDNGDVLVRHTVSDVSQDSEGHTVKTPRNQMTIVVHRDGGIELNAEVNLNMQSRQY
jgi:hypothetical protein